MKSKIETPPSTVVPFAELKCSVCGEKIGEAHRKVLVVTPWFKDGCWLLREACHHTTDLTVRADAVILGSAECAARWLKQVMEP